MNPIAGIALPIGRVVVIGEREPSVAVLPMKPLAADDVVLTLEADDDEPRDECDDEDDGWEEQSAG